LLIAGPLGFKGNSPLNMAQQRLEIVLAETAGFCMGVRRAVRMVLDAANDPRTALPIKTPGPLIHNRQVLQVLERRGVLRMDKCAGDGTGTAVIRAHGLSLQDQEELRRHCSRLLDATCPHVRRLQEIAKRCAEDGYLCVILGDSGHAEVEGVLSYAGDAGRVVAGPQDVAGLPSAGKVAVAAQTTQDAELFRRTVEAIRARYGECETFDTICRSTHLRQEEVRSLAKDVDAMIVVGGSNSANTRRLAEISAATGTPTFHVETEDQLDTERVLQFRRIGLTAGASTPNWMIRRVILTLLHEHRIRAQPIRHRLRAVLNATVSSGVYAGAGAAALTLANMHLTKLATPMPGLCMAVSFFFVLAWHVFNQYSRRESLYLSEPLKADFFMANDRMLIFLGACSAGLSAVLSWLLGGWAFGLVALCMLSGLVYRLRLPVALASRAGFRSLEHLPGSREFFTGLAWAAVVALLPSLARGPAGAWRVDVGIAFLASFLLVVGRTLTLGLGAVEADQLVGRETLAGMLGPLRARRLFCVLLVLLAVLLGLGGCLAGGTQGFCLPYMLVVPYALGCFLVVERLWAPDSALAEAATDAVFYLPGLLALLAPLFG